MIRFCNAFAVLMAALCTAKTASALPLVWRADWPDAKPVETMVHRGTDVELQPQWRINKEPADTTGWTFTTYCQTNAVGPWFGPLPGAFFSHTNDVGAASYNVIVRAQTPGGDVNYTAFARLRMLDSPGYAPGVLPLPTQSIDFADVTVFNAPYYTKQETDERIVALAPAPGNYAAVSNAAMSAAAQTNDFLRLAGGGRISTSEYDFIIGYDRLLAPRSGIWWQDLAAPCGIGCESLLGNLVFVSEGNWVHLPDRPGTLALRSDVAAAAEAATNYTNAAIAEIPVPPPADFSTSNAALVATIEATAPAPGDYETVSNRAMNAGGNFLAVDGPFEWTAEKGITLKNGFLVFDNTTTGGGRLATTYDAVRTDNAYASWDDIITAANAHAEGLNATTGDLAAAATAATNYTDTAIADADTTYRRTVGITNLNQSVQYVNITDTAPSTLQIQLPTNGETKDWMVYINAATNATLTLPAVTWWMADTAYTNAIQAATPTALYFSQVSTNIYILGRQELKEVTP